jgi:hypothetical protein
MGKILQFLIRVEALDDMELELHFSMSDDRFTKSS